VVWRVRRVFWQREVQSVRRFEFKEGSSNKFWEVTVSGNTLTVRFGRIGSAGQEKSKTFASLTLAQKEQDKLIAEKRDKGYKEVEPPSSAKDVPPAAAINPAGPMPDLLVRLDKWPSANRSDYYGKLLRGASPEGLDAFEKKFQLQLPSGFRELYQWRNGRDPNCSASPPIQLDVLGIGRLF